MKVPWTHISVGKAAPLLTVGLRRHGSQMLTAPMMLVDTGADGTLVPIYFAKLLGFRSADLAGERCTVAGGDTTIRRPIDVSGTEIEIHGTWLPLPSLQFAERSGFSLLGRDIIFAHFDLMMTSTYFELLSKKG